VLPGLVAGQPGKETFRTRIPTGRHGREDGIAAAVAFLVSGGAGHITGQNLRFDGGITRSV
jgi:NAD(P)-dependent dehydrogenase (short-subunit alcohol dehydrogenase family)